MKQLLQEHIVDNKLIENIRYFINTAWFGDYDAFILFLGSTGTGKSTLALYIKYALQKHKLIKEKFENFFLTVFPNLQIFLTIYFWMPQEEFYEELIKYMKSTGEINYFYKDYPDVYSFTEKHLQKSIIVIDEVSSFQSVNSKEWYMFWQFAETERYWNNIYFVVGQTLRQFRFSFLNSRVDYLLWLKNYFDIDERNMLYKIKERKCYELNNEKVKEWLESKEKAIKLETAFRTGVLKQVRYIHSTGQKKIEEKSIDDLFTFYLIKPFKRIENEDELMKIQMELLNQLQVQQLFEYTYTFPVVEFIYKKYVKQSQSVLRRKFPHFRKVIYDKKLAIQYITSYIKLTYEKIKPLRPLGVK